MHHFTDVDGVEIVAGRNAVPLQRNVEQSQNKRQSEEESCGATLVNISPNKDGAFDITVDVTAISENKTESTDIGNARKIQAGLVEMEEMLAAVGHNVSFNYDAENDIVEISVNNRPIVKKSVAGDSAVTAMNDVWASTYRHLI
jgi:hypothetical protein